MKAAGLVGSAGDRAGDPLDLGLVARRRRDHDDGDRLGSPHRLERPLDQRLAGELDEGLRAAGSEPLSGAGGRDDRRSVV